MSVDLEAFLERRGERLLRSGREKRLASDRSVTIRGSEWYDHAEERGGNAVSFVQRYYGLSFPEAMQLLLGCEANTSLAKPKPKPFILPKKHSDMRRVFACLGVIRFFRMVIISAKFTSQKEKGDLNGRPLDI